MNPGIKHLKEKATELLHTRQGRNALTFGIFLIIATLFWFLMTLNDEVQRDYSIPVEIADLPDDITLLSDNGQTISVTVKDKGRNLIKYDWGKDPHLTLRFSDFNVIDETRLILTEQGVKTMVRDLFGNSSQIAYIKPDSLVLRYTSRPGVRLPVYADIDVQASPQHIVHGAIVIEPDSVTLYAPQGIPSDIVSVRTDAIAARGVTDTTTYELSLNTLAGMRAIPDKVKVTVPVEPLITKSVNAEIKAVNVPSGYNLLAFPANVQVSFLIPMSLYNSDSFAPVATIDFRDVREGQNSLKVRLGSVPDFYRSVSVSPKEVEYVVEKPLDHDHSH